MQRGFSLVELSIVLVILGLLVGGVLSGQALIRASELRAVTSEYQRYLTATQTFRDKYFAIPGDMASATAFWGQSTACAGASTTGTCNGNGDGALTYAGAASATGEDFQFWKQLALASLIEGNYTGLAGAAGGGADTVPGTNSPKSKLSSGGWSARTFPGVFAGDANLYVGNYANHFCFGAYVAGNAPYNAILKPEEAWNIDTKLDDGKPGTGKVLATFWNNACANSSSASDYTGVYNLSGTALQCALNFVQAF